MGSENLTNNSKKKKRKKFSENMTNHSIQFKKHRKIWLTIPRKRLWKIWPYTHPCLTLCPGSVGEAYTSRNVYSCTSIHSKCRRLCARWSILFLFIYEIFNLFCTNLQSLHKGMTKLCYCKVKRLRVVLVLGSYPGNLFGW